MNKPHLFPLRTWLLTMLGAGGLLLWCTVQRVQRVETVTHTDHEAALVDDTTPTGYAGGKRWLLVPEGHDRSYQWIAETQQMLATKEWRIRHIDTENAPFGREVHAASPYRWWLGLLAWCDHALSKLSLGQATERAALWADPLLHLVLLMGATLFVAFHFGAWPCLLLALGLVTVYPVAGGFLPGAPDDRNLTNLVAVGAILPLLAAFHRGTSSRSLSCLAGVTSGLGLWISPSHAALLLIGLALGGLLAAWLARRGNAPDPTAAVTPPWRLWSLSGSATCLAAYLIEYYPAHLDFQLHAVHPLYGLAWLGLGEVLEFAWAHPQSRKTRRSWTQAARLLLVLASLAALPLAMHWSKSPSLLFGDISAARLTLLPNGTVAKSMATWISRDGLSPALLATCLPLMLLGPAIWLCTSHRTPLPARMSLALALGPVLVTLLIALSQLAWWALVDLMLLSLLVAMVVAVQLRGTTSRLPWHWPAGVGLLLLPGLALLKPSSTQDGEVEFTRLEVEGLLERSLAHWLADHTAPENVFLAPPGLSPNLSFHSGRRGLGTVNWENRDGLAAAVRIVSATTADEAQALLNQRGVTHLILPSWDNDLEVLAGWSVAKPEDTFISAVHRWALPPWLRPRPYQLPSIPGFEDYRTVILEVTDEENPAAAISRTAEYFLETQQLELAAAAGQALQRFPADLGALVALAQVERARGGPPAFTKIFETLMENLAGGSSRNLAWDRRVSLAIVLAQGERPELAREEVARCLEKLDEAKLRFLTPATLFRLLVLCRAFDLSISDPGLAQLSHRLLPAELRNRL
ncbi:hypothetical protein Verru16b_01379 [Lacunisphaera limnophila]|uniref:Uncharacterized protein n=1 Tax=Lacunisphaera limnophila TaxID=1838286 RepID=A0A1D8ATU4_9BACT|nr:hypothetical protein [Lacunisphaera limnophila]AOS44318.1 hypothetical protein Verru16b_01379 [Lacunisphaera limnophila]